MYSAFWTRFAAIVIDLICIFTLCDFIIILLELYLQIPLNSGESEQTASPLYDVLDFLLKFSIGWIYFSLFESSRWGATLGKMALGIKVIDQFGQKLTFRRASARYWSKVISGLPLLLGFIIAGFSKNKQALHDMITSTYVVYKKLYKQHYIDGKMEVGDK